MDARGLARSDWRSLDGRHLNSELMRRESSKGEVSRRGKRAIAEARGEDEFSFRRIKLKASYCFLSLADDLQRLRRIELIEVESPKFNPNEN